MLKTERFKNLGMLSVQGQPNTGRAITAQANSKPHVMANKRLEKRSETFTDDQNQTINKRCFVLLCGDADNHTNYMNLDISINIFEGPRQAKRLSLKFSLHNTIIEMCNDVIQS